jgi:GT2 family glycosyltransferase
MPEQKQAISENDNSEDRARNSAHGQQQTSCSALCVVDDSPRNAKVCIAILNWNGWPDTVDCLASLQRLDYEEREVVVIDNASTNDSVCRIREQFRKTEIIRLEQNLGFAGGCNAGIRYAFASQAKYVWLLNNDTQADAGALRAMVETAEADPRIGAVGSLIFDMSRPAQLQAWGGGYVNLWCARSSHCTQPTLGDKLDYLTGASLLLRCDALQNVGLLDERFFMYWEDADLCFRLRNAGWKLAVARDSRVWHKKNASIGAASSTFDIFLWTSMVRFSQRHAPFWFIPTAIGTTRMITKRVLQLDWGRALRLCQAAAGSKRLSASCPQDSLRQSHD